jgi:hypothetical protein
MQWISGIATADDSAARIRGRNPEWPYLAAEQIFWRTKRQFTFNTTAGLITLPDAAVILVLPAAIAVARPLLLIVAAAVLLEVQIAAFVISVCPLHVVAIAVNCWVLPCVTAGAGFGVTAIEVIQATVTVSVVVLEMLGFCVEVPVMVV